jgi:hypothetical protein
MKFKKLLASVMSGILVFGMLPFNAVLGNGEKTNPIQKVFEDLSLNAEPIDASATSLPYG